VFISVDDACLHPKAVNVTVTEDALTVDLADGRTVIVPLAWYPRLVHGSKKQRDNFEIGEYGIHWRDLDEDLSIKGLLLGNKSGESQRSLARWLRYHKAGRKVPVKTLPLPEWAKQELRRGARHRANSTRRKSKK
jgi:hypothetical protein